MAKTVVRIMNNRFPAIIRALPNAAHDIVEETVFAIESHIKEGMAAAKSGAWYDDHQASAPGEMPAIDTSALVNSIQTEVSGGSGVVATNMEYAAHQEFGAPAGNLLPRPFMTPAAETERPIFMRKCRNLESRL